MPTEAVILLLCLVPGVLIGLACGVIAVVLFTMENGSNSTGSLRICVPPCGSKPVQPDLERGFNEKAASSKIHENEIIPDRVILASTNLSSSLTLDTITTDSQDPVEDAKSTIPSSCLVGRDRKHYSYARELY